MSARKSGGTETPNSSTAVSVDKSDGKNRGWPKGKRRYPKGDGAPKQPLSGYVHFLNERRESVRSENPEITFSELSKTLAAEWSSLGDAHKNKYHEMARKDKDRYDKEFADYQNTDAYKKYIESQTLNESESLAAKKKKKIVNSGKNTQNGGADSKPASLPDTSKGGTPEESDGERDDSLLPIVLDTSEDSTINIPIFTDQFLQHNKARENELRQLRKQATEFEEQNAVLAKHIESMKGAITKLEVETQQQRQNNASLQQHLHSLRHLLTQGFKGVQVPGFKDVTDDNIDEVVNMLLGLVQENPLQHQPLIHTARTIVNRLDYSKLAL